MTREKAKANLSKKEVMSLRLDPRVKYLSDVAARAQRRALTNYMECLLEDNLKNVELKDGVSVYDDAIELWAASESHRFLKLFNNYPLLLTYEEQQLIEFIQDKQVFYEENKFKQPVHNLWGIINLAFKGDREATDYIEAVNAHYLLSTSNDNEAYSNAIYIFLVYATFNKGSDIANRYFEKVHEVLAENFPSMNIKLSGQDNRDIEKYDYDMISKYWMEILLSPSIQD